MRLRNAEGRELRHNAEKSIVLNEYILELFTPERGVVCDLFAGTGSMAVACVKLGRYYFGTELDEETHGCAQQRLERAQHTYEGKW